MSKLHLGVLGSGAGSNMQSIVDAIAAGALDAEIKIVLADVADAKMRLFNSDGSEGKTGGNGTVTLTLAPSAFAVLEW